MPMHTTISSMQVTVPNKVLQQSVLRMEYFPAQNVLYPTKTLSYLFPLTKARG